MAPTAPSATVHNPTLHHFTNLLTQISFSESALASLRLQAQAECILLQTYFTTSAAELQSLKPLALSQDRETRIAAVERRRRKWAEMEEMKRWQEKVVRILGNVKKREENEGRLRGLLKEVGEALLEREVLAREGVMLDAVL